MKTAKARQGLTLVELMVVIVIIGILAGIIFRLAGLLGDRTARARTISRLEHLKQCVESYYTVYGVYPPADGVTWEEPGGSGGAEDGWSDFLDRARQLDPSYQNPAKEYWTRLYPFIYRDGESGRWREHADHAGGEGVGYAAHSNNSDNIGFEWGWIAFTNNVYSIKDGWDNSFIYRSSEPYQTYILYSRGPSGDPDDDVGRNWSE